MADGPGNKTGVCHDLRLRYGAKFFVPLLKSTLEAEGGTIVGVKYFPFGTRDFGPALQQLKEADVDFVWHGIGDDPIAFVKQYHSFGIKAQLVTEITHESIARATDGASVGNLGVSSYFMSVDNPANQAFIEKYNARFAKNSGVRVAGKVPVLPHGESTYVGAWIFAEAARIAQSVELDKLKQAFAQISLEMPRGKVRLDASGGHLLSKTLIGRARADCMFDLVDVAGPVQTVCK